MTQKIAIDTAINLSSKKLLFFSNLFILFTFIFLFVSNLNSQVLINEYFKTTSNQEEWIELIVTEENANLTNLILLDSEILNSSPFRFNGGIKFRDISFWRDIPKGTFIVIYLKNVDNSLLSSDKLKGRLVVKATENTLFELVCENCNLSNWANEAFIIDNEAELFSIANNSTNIHSLGHTSDGTGHFVNNMGILSKLTLSNNEAVSVIPGDALLTYFGGFDENNNFARKNNLVTRGGANRLTSGTPRNYIFTDDLRKPEWNNPGILTITEVSGVYNVKWNRVLNLPQPDNYYTFLLLVTNGTPQAADLPQNGRNYAVNDAIGNSRVAGIIKNNQNGNVDISTGINCGTDYTISVIMGRFRDLDNNHNQFLSNGITYNINSFPTGLIKREAVPNYEILAEGNRTTFCVQKDTSITLRTSLSDVSKFRFTWFQNGTPFLVGTEYGQYSTLNVTASGNFFLQAINQDGCLRTSNLLSININNRPTINIMTNNRYIKSDTLITRCLGEEVELTSETDYGTVSWYKKVNNVLTLVENNFRFIVNTDGEYVSIARDGDCRDTSKIVRVEFLDYRFKTDKLEIAFFKYLNTDKIIEIEIENLSNRTLTFIESDLSIEAPFKLYDVLFPITLLESEKKIIQVIIDSDIYSDREYILSLNNGCNTKVDVKLKPIRVNSEVVINPSQIVFPLKLRCSSTPIDSIISILNNSDFDLMVEVSSKIPFNVVSGTPFSLDRQQRSDIRVSFNSNFNGVYYDTLKILYYNSNNTLRDSVFIPLEAEIFEPILTFKPDSIHWGILTDCEFVKDTVIRLYNNFNIDILINEQFANTDVRFINLPINIPKNDSVDVGIRLTVLNNGSFDFKTSFNSIPCTISNEISFSGSKTEISYNFDDSILNYDTIFSCQSTNFRIKNTRLRITSDVELYTRIDSIYVPNGFETNLNLGDELFNINNISITFTPNNYGNYNDYLIIKYFPCGDIDSILLTGSFKEVNFDLPDTIYFNTIIVGESDSKELEIVSKSTFPFMLKVEEPTTMFFNFTNYQNEIYFSSFEDNFLFNLDFTSDLDGDFIDSVMVQMIEPCLIEKYVYLVGRAIPIDDVDVFFNFSESKVVDANEEFDVTFSVSSLLYDLDDFEITNTEIELELNSNILHFVSATNQNPRPVSYDYDIRNNKLKVIFDKLYETELVLKFRPLLGNDVQTMISISDFKYNSQNNLIKTYDSTLITLTGICSFEERLIFVGENLNLNIVQSNFQSVEIIFNITNGEKALAEVYDSRGSKVRDLMNKYTDIGNYSFKIDDLPTGVYFVKVRNGLENDSKSFVIVK